MLKDAFDLDVSGLPRAGGTLVAVFPEGSVLGDGLRPVLMTHGLPDLLVLVTVQECFDAHVPVVEQAQVVGGVPGVTVASLRFGIDDMPDVPAALSCTSPPIVDDSDAHFTVCEVHADSGLLRNWPRWRRWVYGLLARHALPACRYYRIPEARLVSARGAAHPNDPTLPPFDDTLGADHLRVTMGWWPR